MDQYRIFSLQNNEPHQDKTEEISSQTKDPRGPKFLRNLKAMRKACIKQKSERWGFDFEVTERPILMDSEKFNNKQATPPKKVLSPIFKDQDRENLILAKYHSASKAKKLNRKITPLNKILQPLSEMDLIN